MDWDHHREKDKRYHDAIGTEYDRIVVTPRALLSEVLFRPFARTIRAGARMLDVGCGTGHMLRRFGHAFHTVTGVDHSRTMLQVAAASLAEQHVQAELIEADAIQFLTEATHSYDLITCVGFLHHLMPDMIPGVVQRMANLLAPSGGSLLLAEPIAVEAARLPPAIAKWNTRAVAARQGYSQPVADPDEAPLSRELFYASVDAAGLQVVGEQRTWEVFPHTAPPLRHRQDHDTLLHLALWRVGECISALGGTALGPGWVPGASSRRYPPRCFAAPLQGGDKKLPSSSPPWERGHLARLSFPLRAGSPHSQGRSPLPIPSLEGWPVGPGWVPGALFPSFSWERGHLARLSFPLRAGSPHSQGRSPLPIPSLEGWPVGPGWVSPSRPLERAASKPPCPSGETRL